jgi:putative DNA primase/helicase
MFENATDYTKIKKSESEKKKDAKEIEAERDSVFPDIDGNGKPKSSLRNVVHSLEHFLGGALVGFNEFTCRPYFLKDTPYGGVSGREVSDKDDLALKHYLSCHYRFEPSKELCFEAHAVVAQKYKFHPVKDYLARLEWDGVPRLDHWLIDAFRASGPTEYVEAVGRKILCAAIARIYEPGCKFDYMTVLEGNQGEGKSMSLGMLVGPQWFTDSLGDIHNKDVVDQMLGKWLIEVSELDSIRGREAEAVKAFVSRQVDRVRLSYARRAEDYPRQCIFIGSTNDQEYLTDETGNRRYWPIHVGRARKAWLKENRDQLWAEAKFRYELGEKLYLTKELEAIARSEQEKRFEVDEWEAEVKKIVAKDEGGFFVTTELWRAIHSDNMNGHPQMGDSKRIGKIMRRLGFVRTIRRLDGVRSKGWAKR